MALLFNAGVNACFGAGTRPAIFLKSLELVVLGETFLTPGVWPPPGEAAQSLKPSLAGREGLSPQEWLILRGLAEGQPNKVIAREVGAAEATVKVHVKNIFRKIGVTNRTQAAMWARAHGAIETPEEENAPIGGKTTRR
jgi:two-component system nitrate/nitrite response regulator NarL